MRNLEQVNNYVFRDTLTDDQKLAIQTCPRGNDAMLNAVNDFYESKYCEGRGCLVKALFTPYINRMQILFNCKNQQIYNMPR